MSDRLLPLKDLQSFVRFAETQGYELIPRVGTNEYEVARLIFRDPAGDHPPLVFYKRSRGLPFVTSHGEGTTLVRKFLAQRSGVPHKIQPKVKRHD